MQLKSIVVDNFKSYEERTEIPVSGLSVLMGANSSGKSTALQTLLALKQTIECNSPDIDLLLSGKYVSLGDFSDAINNTEKQYFAFGVSVAGDNLTEDYAGGIGTEIVWEFENSEEKDVVLSRIYAKTTDTQLKLERDRADIYNIFVNGRDMRLSVAINNLLLSEAYVQYDEEFNRIFYDFIIEIKKQLLPGKKSSYMKKSEMAATKTVSKFYFELLREKMVRVMNPKDRILRLAKQIIQDINDYCKYQFKYYTYFNNVPDPVKESVLYSVLKDQKDTVELENILAKYEDILKEKKQSAEGNYSGIEKIDIDLLYDLGNEEKGDNSEYDIVSDTVRIYKQIIDIIIKNIFYLGPIRENPKGLYNIGFETIPKYVGTTGAYFPSVLLRENREKEYILPDGEIDNMTLLEALDEWVSHLNVASAIKVEKKNSFGFSVSVLNTQRRKSDIMNVGIGTSQVLPVLITGLLSERGEYLLFEQPELHLHPYSQSRLADFFVELVKNGRKVIVETHSEYFVLRLRYQLLINNISGDDVKINFFQNKGGTKVSQALLSDYGNLQYPEDFRDETQKLLDDLVKAALEKRDQ